MEKTIVNLKQANKEHFKLLELPFYKKALSLLNTEWTAYQDIRNEFQEFEYLKDGHTLHVFESLSSFGLVDVAVSPHKYVTRLNPSTGKPETIGVGSKYFIRLKEAK